MASPRKPQVRSASPATVAEQAVSKRLKAFYDDIASQDVPKRLIDLLDQLESLPEPAAPKKD